MKSLLKSFHFFPLRKRRTSVSPLATSDSGLRTPDSTDGDRRSAFSLIEVNMAILVIAGGMLSLFTLFPAGLRMSTFALSDTRQSLFADDFFAYFENGILQITDRDEWQNIETFWKRGREGLEEGFSGHFDNDDWSGDATVRKKWDEDLTVSDFKKGTPGRGDSFFLRFRKGKISKYFSKSTKTGSLDAEFVVRIASDYDSSDCLLWRVSLIVSDEGENGWFYDNSVYHRDFRYAELP